MQSVEWRLETTLFLPIRSAVQCISWRVPPRRRTTLSSFHSLEICDSNISVVVDETRIRLTFTLNKKINLVHNISTMALACNFDLVQVHRQTLLTMHEPTFPDCLISHIYLEKITSVKGSLAVDSVWPLQICFCRCQFLRHMVAPYHTCLEANGTITVD